MSGTLQETQLNLNNGVFIEESQDQNKGEINSIG